MGISYLTYDGESSADYGVFISGEASFVRPQRDRSMQSIPGRNGDLIYDNGRYPNVTLQYPAFIRSGFQGNYRDFINFLNSHKSYARLTDTYTSDEYRLAVPSGEMQPRTGPGNTSGKFTIEFSCKPQRFLTSGEDVITLTADGSAENPELTDAQPLIRVYGSGVLSIGSDTLTIGAHSQAYMDIDCMLMDAHCGAVSLNSYLTLSTNDYPVFGPGATAITLGTGITSIEITPRWWRL